jgi:hypothetical protein
VLTGVIWELERAVCLPAEKARYEDIRLKRQNPGITEEAPPV